MNQPRNVTELLQALIRIPSVNPAGDPGVADPGEQACAEYVADFLKLAGAETELQPVLPGRPNVIGRFPSNAPVAGTGPKPRIVFAPHTDTVSVVGMTIDPFAAELRDGKIWGRGATDTKGPMASMLWALYEMREAIPDLSHEIWFAGFMGEEAGQDGAIAFAKEHRADFAVIGEATGLDIVHTHKGSIWLTIETEGRSVHASMPERGVNAIYKMADLVAYFREQLIPRLAAMEDPVLGRTTLNVGVIQGGTKINIVPDQCRMEVDIRTIPSDPLAASTLVQEIQDICPDARVAVRESKALYTPVDHPGVQKLMSCGAKPIGAPWFCDAAILSHAGIPAVAIGPGNMAQAHTQDEWITVEDLEAGVRFFREFISKM